MKGFERHGMAAAVNNKGAVLHTPRKATTANLAGASTTSRIETETQSPMLKQNAAMSAAPSSLAVHQMYSFSPDSLITSRAVGVLLASFSSFPPSPLFFLFPFF